MRGEVVLFSTTPVTLAPIAALIVTSPAPVPLFVIVPVLLSDVVEAVIPAARALLFWKIRLPAPVDPPETVSSFVPRALTKVVPPAFGVTAPLTVNAEVVLFSVIVVTLEPTGPLIVVVPAPAPEFV